MVRIGESGKALALATDCTPRYCRADPVRGGAQAVAESWRNLTAVGALPLALTDNMNFGNPEKPEIMGEFVGAIEGMRAACLALDYPVVSGNVSLYNETSGSAVLPTPVIGGVGLIGDARLAVDLALKRDGDALILRRGAISAPPGICAKSREAKPAHRRRSIWPPSGRTAILCAARLPPEMSPPVTTSATAGSSSRSPRWRWPAAAAWRSTRCRERCRRMPGCLARTRRAT